jgi:acylphosphatase
MTGCRHFLVSGRVQGVFYRAYTQDMARQLGLTGWVRNLPDGQVELVACGDESGLTRLEQWLRQGPPHAQVETVTGRDIASLSFADFSVTR